MLRTTHLLLAFVYSGSKKEVALVPAILSLVLNVAIAVLSLYAWALILFGRKDSGKLAARGVWSLKYFTVLSNLFSGLVSALYVACCLLAVQPLPTWLIVLKLMAATAVMLTFLTVIVLLNPVYGWRSMYRGGNLWMHLFLPLLAALDCCLFVPVGTLPLHLTLFAMLPTAAYAAGYLRAIRLHGAEENGVTYDFYGFLRWGERKIPLVVAGMLLATWIIALALSLASRIVFMA